MSVNTFSPHHITGAEAVSVAGFGEGMGRIWLTSAQCTGSETELMNCTANSSGVNSCTHSQDAAVRCQPGDAQIFTIIAA